MKVLFVASNSRDYLGGMLWDGCRSAFGADNVADATDSAFLRGLHEDWSGPDPSAVLICCPSGGAVRDGHGYVTDRRHRLVAAGEDDFDLLVVVTTFDRAFPSREAAWDWLAELRLRHVRCGGKVAYVETLDSPREVFPPLWPVDAVFRREIDPAVQYAQSYGRKPLPLLGAAPRRWFDWPQQDKDIDVFAVSSAVTPLPGWPERWDALRRVFDTHTRHTALAGSGRFDLPDYLKYLCRSKLCVVAPGGGNSSDGPRQWEAVAAGAIPVFVSQPCRVRDVRHPQCHAPWLRYGWENSDCAFWAHDAEDLPRVIDFALKQDLPAKRSALRGQALEYHTTESRARQMAAMVEADAWRDERWVPW